jgi:hypothetical protein
MPDWISPSVLKDILLSMLALYGAVLSTFNYTQSVRKERRSVVVSLSTAMPTYGAIVGDCFAKIEAINAGHRPVTISTLALEVPEGQRLFSTGSGGAPGMSPNCRSASRTVNLPKCSFPTRLSVILW